MIGLAKTIGTFIWWITALSAAWLIEAIAEIPLVSIRLRTRLRRLTLQVLRATRLDRIV